MSTFEGSVPEGATREQIKYNIYAFGVQVRKFSQKRYRARKEEMRKKWQRKIDFALSCLADNKKWLAEIGEAQQSVNLTETTSGKN